MKHCNGTCQQGRKECTCNYDEVDEIYTAFIKMMMTITIIFVCLIGYLMVAA